jgi:hypothetical protein
VLAVLKRELLGADQLQIGLVDQACGADRFVARAARHARRRDAFEIEIEVLENRRQIGPLPSVTRLQQFGYFRHG